MKITKIKNQKSKWLAKVKFLIPYSPNVLLFKTGRNFCTLLIIISSTLYFHFQICSLKFDSNFITSPDLNVLIYLIIWKVFCDFYSVLKFIIVFYLFNFKALKIH